MFINKKGLNFVNGGHRTGEEIKIKLIEWDSVLFMALNIAGIIWTLILIFWRA